LFLKDFNGVVAHSLIKGIKEVGRNNGEVLLKIGAGEKWDDVCEFASKNNFWGIENLSGVPGEAGAAAVQNIGAYGVEIKDVITEVCTINKDSAQERVFKVNECKYGYRESVFKGELKGEYIVTYIVIKLSLKEKCNLSYGALKEVLGDSNNLSVKKIRETIVKIRDSKLPNPKVLGNGGSFFKNPIVEEAVFISLQKKYPNIPFYKAGEGLVKIPAAWLIEQSGFKGKKINNVGVYDKQALVVVNFGGCSGMDIYNFAQTVIATVKDKFGVELHPEVNFI
jgi:UDP-N-acetylenolpyruvoylglucosamine reductase